MWNRIGLLPLVFWASVAAWPAQAQDAPLSVIDWLEQNTPTPAALPPAAEEPAVTDSGVAPEITVKPLDGPAPRRVGLAPSSVTGLPDDLWAGSDGAALADQLRKMPVLHLPAAQALFYTLLLAEADPPANAGEVHSLARIDALMRMGALEPALALTDQAGADSSPAAFAAYLDASLLLGTEANACGVLNAQPALARDYAPRIFCAARQGDWDTAVLMLGTGRALGAIPQARADMLERFLDPDLFEDASPLPVPDSDDPLAFRIYESIGMPISTAIWPRVYANADLRDLAGWKAQLAAAERLAQTGAIPDNRLLGIYTSGRPAASGGIWDRVRAVQRFEVALNTGSAEAVAKTLPTAWHAMKDQRLAVAFANLFAERLIPLDLPPAAQRLAFEVALMSPHYEQAATAFTSAAATSPVLMGLARGDTAGLKGDGMAEAAMVDAFAGAAADPALIGLAQTGELGRALLDTLRMLEDGTQGDAPALRTALATLRALGLEDTARRAALQMKVLPRP